MKHHQILSAAFAALCLQACTSITVEPLPAGVDEVLIVDNSAVKVEDFVEVMRGAFEDHGIRTRLVREEPANTDVATLTYSALKSWDLATYLCQAEVTVRRGGRPIANAEYHLIGKGGLSLFKWDSVETKMTPVYDQLLINYPKAR
ncbi:MAG: Sbal_3080 family lipoprotein [Planctomycetota bacterium]